MIDGYDLSADLERMSADAAHAFQIWLCLPHRSLADLAATTGDNENTVRSWAMRYRWKEIAGRYDAAQASGLLGALRSAIVRHSFEAVTGRGLMHGRITGQDDDGQARRPAQGGDVDRQPGRARAALGASRRDAGERRGAITADDLRRMATSGNPDDLRRLVDLTTGRGE